MFFNLAKRNVRRQFSNYLIYFATVALTVAMIFAMNNVAFSEKIKMMADSSSQMTMTLIALSVMVAVVTAFVLHYATSYMLKLRSREFGIYMTLGMKRRDIRKVFLQETLIISLIALAAGMALGVLIYQILIALVSNIIGYSLGLGAYTLTAFVLTLVMVVVIFLLSSFSAVHFLRKTRIGRFFSAARRRRRL